jgi:cobalt-zinc-cadmium efflux system membrane fusion protein
VVAYGNSEPDKQFAATVKLVNLNFDENRSAEIHCDFDNADPALIPGMFMTAEVAVANVEALVVPEEAVVRWDNKHYVFVQERTGHFTMTEVTPGVLHAGKQQIENNSITDTSKLVVKNAFALLMKIKNTEEEG